MTKSENDNIGQAGATMVTLGVTGKTVVGATLAKVALAGTAGTKVGAIIAGLSNPVTAPIVIGGGIVLGGIWLFNKLK